MPEKAVTERARQEIYKDKIYSPINDRLIHDEGEPAAEDPRTINLPANLETQKTDVRMGRAQDESGIVWITAIFMVIFHAGAVAALFFFSWTNLIVAAVLYVLAINFGIGMGYHRLLVHRGYHVSKAIEYFLSVCGTLALEGGPISWVATHRVHHQHSDQEGDPHTPQEGTWWAHMGWIISGRALNTRRPGWLITRQTLPRIAFRSG
jgi:fatty-acid desaturase